jgi:hypothetical protein
MPSSETSVTMVVVISLSSLCKPSWPAHEEDSSADSSRIDERGGHFTGLTILREYQSSVRRRRESHWTMLKVLYISSFNGGSLTIVLPEFMKSCKTISQKIITPYLVNFLIKLYF